MRVSVALILLLVLTACRRVFRYTDLDPTTVQNGMKRLEIDGSYQFYVRQVEEDTAGRENKLQSEGLVNKEQLIEVEYLFISQQNVVYVSTISDVYKQRYRQYYLGDEYVNAYDFQTFLFGKRQNNEIHFEGWKGERSDTWRITLKDDSVFIDDVIEKVNGNFDQQMPVREALNEKVFFKKVKGPLLVFHENGSKKDTVLLRHNTLHLLQRRARYHLYLQFEGNARKRKMLAERSANRRNFTTIRFPEKRLAYNPCQVFGCDSLNRR